MTKNAAAIAAHRAYLNALTVGAAAYTAFDVACAAYRASWPGLDDSELRSTVAEVLARMGRERSGNAGAV
jgi:hypothetical protein